MRKYGWRSALEFNPENSFFELKAVKFTFVLALTLAGILTCVIAYNSNIDWRFDYLGMNHFLTVFKLPLGVLATLIPVIALLAANHRSVQTKEQLRVTVSNNNFGNYFRHVEQFDKFVDERSGVEKYVTNKDKLHAFLFPNALDGDLSASTQIEVLLNAFLKEVELLAKQLIKNEFKPALITLGSIKERVEGFFGDFGMRRYAPNMQAIPIPGGSPSNGRLNLTDSDLGSLFRDLGNLLESLEKLAKFDRRFSFSADMYANILNLQSAPKLILKGFKQNQSVTYRVKIFE